MIAVLVLIFVTAGVMGLGLAVLAGVMRDHPLPAGERLAFAFALGCGALGWLAFFPGLVGYFGPVMFAVILGAGTLYAIPAIVSVARELPAADRFSAWETTAIAGIAAALVMDLMEGLSPPIDADTLAYHFTTPKLFLEAGRIFLIPRALDGAVPLLHQLSYAASMSLGGTQAVTLWTMLSGWGAAAVFYVVARRYLSRPFSLVGVLLLLTTPAIVFGAGTGQVEVRNGMLALVVAAAVVRASGDGGWRWALVAGLAAGFFAGGKYTGLLLVFAYGVVCLFHGRRLWPATVFAAAAMAAGGQWYAFNAWHIGDPVFPMLWGVVDYVDGFPWNDAQAAFAREIAAREVAVEQSLLWFFAYPFRTILWPEPAFESLRVGLGPVLVITAPFAVAAAAMRSQRFWRHDIFWILLSAAIFYGLWFFLGPSQRIRHLVPIYPLVLLGGLVAIDVVTRTNPATARFVTAGLLAAAVIQLGGHGLHAAKYTAFLFGDEDRTQFLEANLPGIKTVEWINRNIKKSERVLIPKREWLYYVDVDFFYAHPTGQAVIELRPDSRDVELYAAQLASAGISHVVTPEGGTKSPAALTAMTARLAGRGCAELLRAFEFKGIKSRTLESLGGGQHRYLIYRVRPRSCAAAG